MYHISQSTSGSGEGGDHQKYLKTHNTGINRWSATANESNIEFASISVLDTLPHLLQRVSSSVSAKTIPKCLKRVIFITLHPIVDKAADSYAADAADDDNDDDDDIPLVVLKRMITTASCQLRHFLEWATPWPNR